MRSRYTPSWRLSREKTPDDERSVEITLTDAGEAVRLKAERVPAEVSRAIGLDEHATEELRATLRQLTNAINVAATLIHGARGRLTGAQTPASPTGAVVREAGSDSSCSSAATVIVGLPRVSV
jgi:hypothetical protein